MEKKLRLKLEIKVQPKESGYPREKYATREKVGHHRSSFQAKMGPAAYNTALSFKKLRALDFCGPTPMPMTDVEVFSKNSTHNI